MTSKVSDAVVGKVARAIGATPAKMGGPVGKYLWDVDLANAARAAIEAIRNGDEGMLPDIHAEGERLANETPKTNGTYLWTDLVGAIQTGIAEERARHVRLA